MLELTLTNNLAHHLYYLIPANKLSNNYSAANSSSYHISSYYSRAYKVANYSTDN